MRFLPLLLLLLACATEPGQLQECVEDSTLLSEIHVSDGLELLSVQRCPADPEIVAMCAANPDTVHVELMGKTQRVIMCIGFHQMAVIETGPPATGSITIQICYLVAGGDHAVCPDGTIIWTPPRRVPRDTNVAVIQG